MNIIIAPRRLATAVGAAFGLFSRVPMAAHFRRTCAATALAIVVPLWAGLALASPVTSSPFPDFTMDNDVALDLHRNDSTRYLYQGFTFTNPLSFDATSVILHTSGTEGMRVRVVQGTSVAYGTARSAPLPSPSGSNLTSDAYAVTYDFGGSVSFASNVPVSVQFVGSTNDWGFGSGLVGAGLNYPVNNLTLCYNFFCGAGTWGVTASTPTTYVPAFRFTPPPVPGGQITLLQTPHIPTPTSSPGISELPEPENFFSQVGSFLWEDMNYRGLYENTTSFWNGILTTDAAKAGAEGLSSALKTISSGISLYGDAKALASGGTIDDKIYNLAIRHIFDAICTNGNCENASALQEFAMDAIQEAIDYLEDNGLILDPASLLLTANTLIWEHALIPELDKLALDPPDVDYQKIYQAALFGELLVSNEQDPELAKLVTQAIRSQQEAYAYLKAINVSFDRYVTAYENGDADSAIRQSFAFVEYLGLYDRKLLETATELDELAEFVQVSGFSDFEVDALALDSVRSELLANGLPSSLLGFIGDLGLSEQAPLIEELVMSSLQDLMSIDDLELYGTLQLQSELFTKAAQSRISAIPNPGTIYLVALSTLALIFIRRYKIS